MKINLAENMLRFGVKNLNETATSKVKTLAEQEQVSTPAITSQAAEAAYKANLIKIWPKIYETIAIGAWRTRDNVANKQIMYNWKYPQDQSKTKGMQNTYTIGTDAKAFDTEFKKRLTAAVEDANWLATASSRLNTALQNDTTTIKLIQTAIFNKMGGSKNPAVASNGTPGRNFVDGVFGNVSTKAFALLAIDVFQPHITLERTGIKG